MKKWQIKVPIFDAEILLIYSEDNLHVIDTYIEDKYNYKIEYINQTTVARTYILPCGLIIIGLKDLNKNYILHECAHVIFELLDAKGLEGQESFCYLLEWLYFKVLQLLKLDD